ncbi:MAG: ATP-binding protein [Planctomycetota bacterium]|nr:ATP-binding protein [Planctomycetota bacterium]
MTKLVIPNTLTEAMKVQQALVAEAELRGFTESATFAIRLALDEALSNAVRHGNENDPAKKVVIEYSVTVEEVRVSVCDQGKGFRPEELPDPTADEFLERPHGRGVMLMRAYMTEVSFNDRGNCVTLIKRRGCKLPGN